MSYRDATRAFPSRVAGAIIALAALLVGGSVLGQSGVPAAAPPADRLAGGQQAGPDDDRARAVAHFRAGQKHFDLGEFSEALAEFKEAYRAKDDPTLLYNIGLCQVKLNDDQAALHSLRSYLRLAREAPNRKAVQAKIDELEARLPAIQAVQSTPPARPEYLPPPRPPGLLVSHPADPALAGGHAGPGAEPHRGWLPWVGGGAAVALAAGAIVAHVSVGSRFDELRTSCGSTTEGCTEEQVDGVKERVLIERVLWAGATVAGVATGFAIVLRDRTASVAFARRF